MIIHGPGPLTTAPSCGMRSIRSECAGQWQPQYAGVSDFRPGYGWDVRISRLCLPSERPVLTILQTFSGFGNRCAGVQGKQLAKWYVCR